MKQPTISEITAAFITYLKEQNLYRHLPEVVELLDREARRNQDIAVISATPLSTKEKGELTKALHTQWGEHPLVFTTDDTLLSGLVIKYQDQLVDLSGHGQLSHLANVLKTQ